MRLTWLVTGLLLAGVLWLGGVPSGYAAPGKSVAHRKDIILPTLTNVPSGTVPFVDSHAIKSARA